jgi:predicted DNA-binding protein (MmcQ/YjbR family)
MYFCNFKNSCRKRSAAVLVNVIFMDIDILREYCLSLPGATEDIKWGHDLCFSVGSKMFSVTGLENDAGISFKVPEEDYEELAAREGFIPAPYMARNKWVLLTERSLLPDKELQKFIKQSYELVRAKLPAKVKKELEAL